MPESLQDAFADGHAGPSWEMKRPRVNAAISEPRAVMEETFGVIERATAVGLHGIHEAFVFLGCVLRAWPFLRADLVRVVVKLRPQCIDLPEFGS